MQHDKLFLFSLCTFRDVFVCFDLFKEIGAQGLHTHDTACAQTELGLEACLFGLNEEGE